MLYFLLIKYFAVCTSDLLAQVQLVLRTSAEFSTDVLDTPAPYYCCLIHVLSSLWINPVAVKLRVDYGRNLSEQAEAYSCCLTALTRLTFRVVFAFYPTVQMGVKFYLSGQLLHPFPFMLPCIVIDFFLNNQTTRTNYPNLFCYKSLHVSGIFFAHHQELSTVHSVLVSFMQVLMTASKHSQDGTAVPAWLCLEAVIKTCMKLTSAECTVENSWWWAKTMLEKCRVL